jgi:hypothetical protein
VNREKITSGPKHSFFLGGSDGRFGRAEGFVGPGLDLDKNDSPVTVDHDKVDLAGFAGKIARKIFKTFSFEESLATFFAPSAEQCFIS